MTQRTGRGCCRRDLYLQVSGNIDGLSAAMKAGRSVLNEFGTAADNTADEVRKAFASLGGDSVEQSARQIERAYSASASPWRPSDRSSTARLFAHAATSGWSGPSTLSRTSSTCAHVNMYMRC